MPTLFVGGIPDGVTANYLVELLCRHAGVNTGGVEAVKMYTRPGNTSCAHLKVPTAAAAQKLLALQAVGFDVRLAREPTGRQQV